MKEKVIFWKCSNFSNLREEKNWHEIAKESWDFMKTRFSTELIIHYFFVFQRGIIE